jgi:hypothetical protein
MAQQPPAIFDSALQSVLELLSCHTDNRGINLFDFWEVQSCLENLFLLSPA